MHWLRVPTQYFVSCITENFFKFRCFNYSQDLNKLPGVSRSLRPEDLDPAIPPQIHQGSSSDLQERRRLQRRTNFKFGNDPPSHITSYTEFAQIMEKPQPQKPCSPPLNAEVIKCNSIQVILTNNIMILIDQMKIQIKNYPCQIMNKL